VGGFPLILVASTPDIPRTQEGGVLCGLEPDTTGAVCAVSIVGLQHQTGELKKFIKNVIFALFKFMYYC
jgi:hypothetical protein